MASRFQRVAKRERIMLYCLMNVPRLGLPRGIVYSIGEVSGQEERNRDAPMLAAPEPLKHQGGPTASERCPMALVMGADGQLSREASSVLRRRLGIAALIAFV